MSPNITPKQAFEYLSNSIEYTYLDVRTVQEFAAGHPTAAKNVPLLELDSGAGRWVPNEGFLAVVEANFSKDRKLIVGCKSGGRSANACLILASAGYKNLWNVDGGFVGRHDPAGNWIQPGWAMSGFPVEREAKEGSNYEVLANKVGA